VAVDPSYLRAAFRETEHTSVREFIVHTRLQQAKELLGRGENLRLSEIATMVGYDDAGYLSKSFKRYYGMSPTEYDRNAQSANRSRRPG
jgi:two-component system response regulator YesN